MTRSLRSLTRSLRSLTRSRRRRRTRTGWRRHLMAAILASVAALPGHPDCSIPDVWNAPDGVTYYDWCGQ